MGISDPRKWAMQRTGRRNRLDVYVHANDSGRRIADDSQLFTAHTRVPSF